MGTKLLGDSLKLAVLITMGLVLAACSSVTQQLDPEIFYKKDIKIVVNGYEYEGVTTVPKAPQYDITLMPKGNLDMVLIRSCARQDSSEKQNKGFFIFKSSKEFKYTYRPNPGLEDVGTCPLRVDVYESKGRHSWAFLEFEHPDYQVLFSVDCNGRRQFHNGVGACQMKEGLIARLHFNKAIRFATPKPDHCAMPKKTSNYVYKWPVSYRECIYHFDQSDGKIGKVTMLGYRGVLVREAP